MVKQEGGTILGHVTVFTCVLPLFMQQNSLLCFHVWPSGTDNTSYELGQFKNNPALTDDVKNVSHPAYQMADADNALQGYTNKL